MANGTTQTNAAGSNANSSNAASNDCTGGQTGSALITALQNLTTAINGLTQVVTKYTPAWPLPQLP